MTPLAAHSLLRCNDPPDAIGRSHILDSIQNLDYLLEGKASRKAQLLALLAAVTKEEEELITSKHLLSGILSSLRLIPPEIVGIFVGFAFDRLRPFELLEYTRVSRGWREAILKTPSLWTILSLPIHVTNSNIYQVIEGIKLWIGRTGILPLFISLEGTVSNLTCARTLLLSLPEKRRCTSLFLGPRFVDALVDDNSPPAFENLGSFTALPTEYSSEFRLKSLSIRCYRSISASNFSAPWPFLRNLDLECPSLTFGFLTIILKCTNVEECSFTFHISNARMDSAYSIDNDQDVGIITLHYLRRLRLVNFRSTGGILPHLILPKLDDLELRAATKYSGDNGHLFPQDTIADVADLIKRSGCRLERLHLRELELDEESSLPLLLPHLTFLVNLSIGHSFVAIPHILDAVADGESFPALTNLQLVAPHDTISPYTFHNSVSFHPKLEKARLDSEDGHNWKVPTTNIVWCRRNSSIEEN
ncbi:hypothetical protein GALMADRAFT_215153 [Galerina marginata CBS 339.88]|uniref:F-box domain-containing protein n=1 Tax=Galerina marginata (strain CBS 339.88) TaxID=685588 RepID=A0A067SRV9_GALM3|nr:hypothetical protein GALMADRAFT_215153 [Galerina marginata CBS 339.88]